MNNKQNIIEEYNRKIREGIEWLRKHGFVQEAESPWYWDNPRIDNGFMKCPIIVENEDEVCFGFPYYRYEVVFSAEVDAHSHHCGDTPEMAMKNALEEFDGYFGTTGQLDNVKTFRQKVFFPILEEYKESGK